MVKLEDIKRQHRLRVVPLSLSLSDMTQKKATKKNEILGAGRKRKEGLPPKPKSLLFHSQVNFWCEISNLINRIQ